MQTVEEQEVGCVDEDEQLLQEPNAFWNKPSVLQDLRHRYTSQQEPVPLNGIVHVNGQAEPVNAGVNQTSDRICQEKG